MAKFRLGDREFLNLAGFHEDASFSYNMEVDKYGYFHGYINVRDCGENISLELNVHNDEWTKNSEFKIDTMIRLLRAAKRDLKRARQEMKKIKKAKAKEKD